MGSMGLQADRTWATWPERIHFALMSLVHETLYGWFRDPYAALSAAGLRHGQRVLEIGCGPGFFTIPAAHIVGESGRVCAVDISPLAVNRTREKMHQAGVKNVEVIVADAAHTGLPDGSFDLIFVFGFRHARGEFGQILREMKRVLRPGGILATEGQLWHGDASLEFVTQTGRIFQFRKADS